MPNVHAKVHATVQATVEARTLPLDSLLAQHAGASAGTIDYTDCLTIDVGRTVNLGAYITAFYNSHAFRPERWALHAIGKRSGGADVAALAAGEVTEFAAWTVIARTDKAILLQDFQKRTCSWLCVEELAASAPTIKGRTRLYFGSSVRAAERLVFKALMPVHKIYAKALIGSAGKALLRG